MDTLGRYIFRKEAARQVVEQALKEAATRKLTARQRDALIQQRLQPIEREEHRLRLSQRRAQQELLSDPRWRARHARRQVDISRLPRYEQQFYKNIAARAAAAAAAAPYEAETESLTEVGSEPESMTEVGSEPESLTEVEEETEVDDEALAEAAAEAAAAVSAAAAASPSPPRRSREPIGNPALSLWEEPERARPDVLRQLLRSPQHKRNIYVNTAGNIKATMGAQSICSVYSSEGYDCMIQDSVRNAAYKQGIVAARDAQHWLEIGPGPALTLTRMVWDAHRGAHVVAVEVNEDSARTALKRARDSGRGKQLSLIQGYSTSPSVRRTLAAEEPFDALLQEILGFIATSEGVIPVIANLRATLPQAPAVYVPRYVATFFALTHVRVPDLVTAARAAHVNVEERTVLTQRLPFTRIQPLGDEGVGVLEFVDLATVPPLDDITATQHDFARQEHVHTFRSEEPVTVNSLSLFIWVGFSGDRDRRRRGVSSTNFPYGVRSLQHVVQNVGASFSTYSEDEAVSHSWKNMVLCLKQPLQLGSHSSITVTAVSRMGAVAHKQPMPTYSFHVVYSVDGRVASSEEYNIDNLYPSFEPVSSVAPEDVDYRLHYEPFQVGLPEWAQSASASQSVSRAAPAPARRADDMDFADLGFDFGPSPAREDDEEEQYIRQQLQQQREAMRAEAEQYMSGAEHDVQEERRQQAAADEAEAEAYEQQEAQHAAAAALAAQQAAGQAYVPGCYKHRLTPCPSMAGCEWKTGKGCRSMFPRPPPTGCSRAPQTQCRENTKCKWTEKGCRVDRSQLQGGGGGSGYSMPFFGGFQLK